MEMEGCPRLLSLIAEDCEMVEKMEEGRGHGCSEEKKLELRLGLPGQDWPCKHASTNTRDGSSSSFHDRNNGSYAQKSPSNFHGRKAHNDDRRHVKPTPFLQGPPPIPMDTVQKRTATPVVGWPPVRSSRRILAGAGSPTTSPQASENKRNESKAQFVKINMDGVRIGRKLNLNAYDSYEKLSSAVDQLFKSLLAAQKDSSDGGSGEYTLVYEDNEGDRMLVGDVPWNMFVSAAKRLRVLKSSELPARTVSDGSKADPMAI